MNRKRKHYFYQHFFNMNLKKSGQIALNCVYVEI